VLDSAAIRVRRPRGFAAGLVHFHASEAAVRRLAGIRHFALDLDGTLYLGGRLFEATPRFLQLLRSRGIGRTFFTNNSSRSTRDYVRHLRAMGIDGGEDEILISTHSALMYLRARHPNVKRVFVLGTPALQEEIGQSGYELCEDDAGDEPDAVVVGFDTTLGYARVCRAAYWIGRGKLFVATHPDRICPTDQPTMLPDCGAICALLTTATGRAPDAVLGKPHALMIEALLRRRGLKAEEVAVVGDRIYTDMAMAQAAGAMSILVLSGETTAEQADQAQPRPDLVVRDVGELADRLAQATEMER
jgi:HAD superfamily hydrolase (TIGR01450 family)